MSKHTLGRVKVQHPHAGERGWEVAFEPGLEQLCQNITEANARRLVACWNACEGIETYALELMTGDLAIKQQIAATGSAKPPKPTSKAVEYRRQRDELLKALVNLLPFAIDGLDDRGCNVDEDEYILFARAAIAKATGGEA
jgi:hypothetical protein